jgi:hypothetical protein
MAHHVPCMILLLLLLLNWVRATPDRPFSFFRLTALSPPSDTPTAHRSSRVSLTGDRFFTFSVTAAVAKHDQYGLN